MFGSDVCNSFDSVGVVARSFDYTRVGAVAVGVESFENFGDGRFGCFLQSLRGKNPVGLEYKDSGLTCGFTVLDSIMLRCVLVGESAEDRSAAHLVIGEVDHWWVLGFGLDRCELPERSVWPRVIEVVQIDR
jgi:hypothetical protein